MKDLLLSILILGNIVVIIYFVVVSIKSFIRKNNAEKQALRDSIQNYKDKICENEKQHEKEVEKAERERIHRDIRIALGYSSDKLVDAVVEYSPRKLLAANNLSEMKREIQEAEDDYDFANQIKEIYLPIVGREKFSLYDVWLQYLKPIIRLHKELTPQDIVAQIDFYIKNDNHNINDVKLLSCIKDLELHLDPYDDLAPFLFSEQVKNIVECFIDHFNLPIGKNGIYGVIHPSDHSSYRCSSMGVSRIFARTLFYLDEIHGKLSALDEEVFVDAIDKYFFYEVCYDIKNLKVYLPEIINYVKAHRSFASDI